MTHSELITQLEKAIERLKKRIDELDDAIDQITPFSPEERKQIRQLNFEQQKMIATKNALQTDLRERRAASGTIPLLTDEEADEFTNALEELNQVIKADQAFDVIVAVARGVSKAAEEINSIV